MITDWRNIRQERKNERFQAIQEKRAGIRLLILNAKDKRFGLKEKAKKV